MANIRLGNLLWKDNTQPISVSNPVNTKDVNSDSIEAELTAVKNELELVKAELQEIKANQLSGDQKVQLSGTLTELEQARELLEAISGKDFATQTTLAAVLAKLADLESELATIKANQLSGDQKVQLSGNDVVIGLLADRPPASEMRGRGYYAWDETDGHKLKYSDGTNWVVNQ